MLCLNQYECVFPRSDGAYYSLAQAWGTGKSSKGKKDMYKHTSPIVGSAITWLIDVTSGAFLNPDRRCIECAN